MEESALDVALSLEMKNGAREEAVDGFSFRYSSTPPILYPFAVALIRWFPELLPRAKMQMRVDERGGTPRGCAYLGLRLVYTQQWRHSYPMSLLKLGAGLKIALGKSLFVELTHADQFKVITAAITEGSRFRVAADDLKTTNLFARPAIFFLVLSSARPIGKSVPQPQPKWPERPKKKKQNKTTTHAVHRNVG